MTLGAHTAVGRRLLSSPSSLLLRTAMAPRALTVPAAARAFSISALRARSSLGPLPSFPPTSDPRLDEKLDYIREELFIPPHLLKAHRNLIYKEKNHHILLEEPLYFTIDDNPVELKPKMNAASVPRSLVAECVKLMRVPSDFDTLPGLVLGYYQAHNPLKLQQLEKMSREACFSGRADVFLTLMEAAEMNGFRVNRKMAREIACGLMIQSNVSDQRFVIKAVKRAMRFKKLLAEQDLLPIPPPPAPSDPPNNPEAENIKNAPAPPVIARAPIIEPNEGDWHHLAFDPVVIGILAGMSANASIRFNSSLDHHSTTARFIRKMFEHWALVERELSMPFPEIDGGSNRDRRIARDILFIFKRRTVNYALLVNQLRQAEQVLSTTAKLLKSPPPLGSAAAFDQVFDSESIDDAAKRAHLKQLIDNSAKLRLELPKLGQMVDHAKQHFVAVSNRAGYNPEGMEWEEIYKTKAMMLDEWLKQKKASSGSQIPIV